MDNKILVTCRIRRPEIQPYTHLQQGKIITTAKSQPSITKKSISSQSPKQVQGKMSSLEKDQQFFVFTSNNGEKQSSGTGKQIRKIPKLVASSQHPITQELLEQYIKSDQDLIRYRASILQNAQIFKFDQVYGCKTPQSFFYNQLCKDKISKSLNGLNSSFILVGPPKSGKSYTLIGCEIETEKGGIIVQAIDDLSNLIEINKQSQGKHVQFQMRCQIFCVYNNEVIDLMQRQTQKGAINIENQNKESEQLWDDITKVDIKRSLEFRQAYRQAQHALKMLSSEGELLSSNIHTVIKLLIYREDQLLSQINFLELADYNLRNQEFSVFSNYLFDISTAKGGRIFSNQQYQDSKLIHSLVDSLNRGEDNCAVLVCTVSPNSEINDQEQVLGYASKLKEKIDDFYQDIQLLPDPMRLSKKSSSKFVNLLALDIDDVIREIFSFTESTQGMDPVQVREWVLAKERQLQQLELELDNQDMTAKSTPSLVDRERKIIEARKFIDDIKKNNFSGHGRSQKSLLGEQNRLNQLSRSTLSRSIPRFDPQQPQDEFQNLVTKYQRTKQKLEETQRQGRTLQQHSSQRSNSRQMDDAQDIIELKRNIMDKIDRAISDSPGTALSSAPMRGRSQSAERILRLKQQRERSELLIKEQLEDQIAEREFNKELEKSFQYQKKAAILNDELLDTKNKVHFLEESIRKKDKLIIDYENELDQKQHQLNNEMQELSEKRSSIAQFSQQETELRYNVQRLEKKLAKKSQQLQASGEENALIIQRSNEEKQQLIEERIQSEHQCSELKEQIDQEKLRYNELENNFIKTKGDLEALFQQNQKMEDTCRQQDQSMREMESKLREQQLTIKEVEIQKIQLQEQIKEQKNQYAQLENKLAKTKRKSDEEKQHAIEEKNKEILKRREKAHQMKQQLKELHQRIIDLQNEGQNLKGDNDKLLSFEEQMRKELQIRVDELSQLSEKLAMMQHEAAKQQSANQELEIVIQKEISENQNLNKEARRLNQLCEEKDSKILLLSESIDRLKKTQIDFENEYSQLREQYRAQQTLITKLEEQNDFLQNIQNNEIDKFDQKIIAINEEMAQQKAENNRLRQVEQDLRHEIALIEKSSNKQKDKLEKDQLIIKQLRDQLEEMDEKVRDLIFEKHTEIKELQSTTSLYASKIKIQDDDTQMIQPSSRKQRQYPQFNQEQQQQYAQGDEEESEDL